MRKLTRIALLCALLVIPVFAQRIYWPGMGSEPENWGRLRLDNWPDSSFVVTWSTFSYPGCGYPYHSGIVEDINDTLQVSVYFDNRTGTNYSLSGESPEDWFYPVLYDPFVDVFTSPPLADTSAFDFRFEHWVSGVPTSDPDTIFCLSSIRNGHGKRYALFYSLWGVSPGTYRVVLKPTGSKPTGVDANLDSPYNYFEVARPQYLQDTLNAFTMIAENALFRREMTLFNTYVDTIFDYNAQALPGWALRYHGYASQDDTTNALAALDSFLVNLEGRIDPLIPDSSDMTPVHESWLEQWEVDYRHYRARMLYPEFWRYHIGL